MNRANRPSLSRISGSSYASKLLGRSGDGSTLSLDFTTGVLDPRLTFTRTSDATFINSSGLVQWANANIVRRSEDCTNWGGAQNITPTADAAVAPNGTQTADQLNLLASSYRYNITATSPQRVVNGVQYTGSIWIRAVSGTASVTLRINNNITGANQGVKTVTVTETWTREFVSFTLSSSTGTAIEFGLDQRSIIGGANVAANVYVWGMQIQPGNVVGEYLPTTTTENYNTPRFDYDPTTLVPQGLRIEGQATNLVLQSDTLPTPTNWTANAVTRTNVSTVTPDGNTTATTCGLSHTGSGSFRSSTITVTASTAYTFSFWAKNNGGSVALYRAYNVSGSADIVAETSYFSQINGSTWTRVQFTFTTPVGCTSVYVYPLSQSSGTSNVLIWGAQLETGSGASSYIPTGASQVTRTADNCYIYDTTSSGGLSWFKTATQGTFYVEMFKRSAGTAFAAVGFGTRATATQDFMLYQAVGNNWLSFNWGTGEYTTNYSALSSPFLIKAAVALSPSTPATEADSTVSINGSNSALNTGPNIALPFTSDLFCIGSRGPSGGTASSQNYAETAIRRIKFFPFAMTAAQMNALTTL